MAKRASYAGEPYWGRPIPGWGSPTPAVLDRRASPRPPTAPTAPAGSSPATAPATGCSRRCTASGWPPRPPPSTPPTASSWSTPGWSRRSAARRRRTSRRTAERDTCAPWIEAELALLVEHVRVVVALGSIGWDATLRSFRGLGWQLPDAQAAVRPRRRGDARPAPAGEITLLGCYHPSQQNTFTGRLTAPMLDAVLGRAAALR